MAKKNAPITAYHPTDRRLREQLQETIRTHYNTPDLQTHLHPLLGLAPNTDVGNAIRLHARYGHILHYVSDWGVWLVWNGSRWRKDDKYKVIELAKEMTEYIDREAAAQAAPPLTKEQRIHLTATDEKSRQERDEMASRLWAWKHSSQSKARIDAAVELLKSEAGITVLSQELDCDDSLLNFPNGTLELYGLVFREARKEDLITKVTGVDYDANATCPQWIDFMKKVSCGRSDLDSYIQVIAGMGLYGKILDDMLAIFHGVGGNGKTVWVEVIKDVLGDYGATATADLFTSKPNEGISNDIARLAGVRFLSASETGEGKFLDEALVKGLTGGDRRTARFLRQEFFEFYPKFTACLLTNYAPVIKGTDSGIWRRLRLIPWEYNFENDPQREDKPLVLSRLRAEAPGIVNWLLQGLCIRFSLKSLDDITPAVVRSATARYREDSDILGQFLEDKVLDSHTSTVTKDALYTIYAQWAKENGYNAMSSRTLSSKLELRGWKWKRITGGKHAWIGYRLKTDEDVEEENIENTLTATGVI